MPQTAKVLINRENQPELNMNALQPLDTIEVSRRHSSRQKRKVRSPQSQARQVSTPLNKSQTQKQHKTNVSPSHHSQPGITAEITIKLVLSWVVTSAAIASLCKLVPYNFSQQAKLREIDTTVQEAQKRVSLLRQDFTRNFDPQQTVILMQEYSSRLPADRIPVILEESQTTEQLLKR
jgi:hypothetical protein